MCCDTLAISQRAELSSAIETGNDTYEVSVGPNLRKRQLMEEAQNPENVSSTQLWNLMAMATRTPNQTMSVGAVLYPATRGR